MKTLLTLLMTGVLLWGPQSQAGDAKDVLTTTLIQDGPVMAELEPFGIYALSGTGEFGAGLGLSFVYDNLWGMEAEYTYLTDSERHLTMLNGFIVIPLANMEIRPFVGGGAWSKDEVSAAAQGGVEVLRDVGPVTLTVGARYIWLDTDTGFTGFTAGLRWLF